MWWSAITTAISGITGTSWFKWVATGLVVIIVLGGGAYLWCDYQDAKAEVVKLRGKLETTIKKSNEKLAEAEAINKKNAGIHKEKEKQHEKDFADLLKRYEKKKEEAEKLSMNREKVKEAKRPENEKECPLHPAINVAFDILRSQAVAAGNGSLEGN